MGKLTRETLRQREAFDFYLSLGNDRSLEKVSKKFGVSEVSAQNWSRRFLWQQRVADKETRIADIASAKVESELVDYQMKLMTVSDAVLGLFVKRLKSAVDADGELKPRGYKPSALDAKIWSELKRDILSNTSGAQPAAGSGFGDAAFDGMNFEQIERIVIERIKRISDFRERSDPGSGQ